MKKKYPNLPKSMKSIIQYPDIFSEENVKKLSNILTVNTCFI